MSVATTEAEMFTAIWEWIKGLFGLKGSTQFGSRNKSISGVTASENARVVIVDGKNVFVDNSGQEQPREKSAGNPAIELSTEEKAIVLKMASLPDSLLMYTKNDLGPILSVDGYELFDVFNGEARMRWIEAFEHLLKLGILKDIQGDGQVFQISTAGRRVAKELLLIGA